MLRLSLISVLGLLCQWAPLAAAAEILLDDEHLPALLARIEAAERSLDCSLYLAVLPDNAGPSHPVGLLAEALVAAHERGCLVRVLLDAGEAGDRGNAGFARRLRQAGIAVRQPNSERSVHEKVLCADRRVLILGSANWSWSALRRNVETGVVLDDETAALSWLERFEDLWSGAQPPP